MTQQQSIEARTNVQGVVKFFDAIKGYGFLTLPDGNDVFVHITATQRAGLEPPVAGQVIICDVARDIRHQGRLCATNLRDPNGKPVPVSTSNVVKLISNDVKPKSVCDLPIAADWYKPAAERVRRAAPFSDEQWLEAIRATIEVIVRKLMGLGWKRLYTSPHPGSGRAESRYLQKPRTPRFEIRISNHDHPRTYHGQYDYVITREALKKYRVADIVAMIRKDAKTRPNTDTVEEGRAIALPSQAAMKGTNP